ncbi:hypothetical protein [Mesobacterium pallidum]|uniref:hypothetical protein n=1 Tax=Mesobacterium pallidum TaxID=2872037 RepID=UPI001EE2F2C2|nr:hypothetical protein [Mesobacterium pallidum]
MKSTTLILAAVLTLSGCVVSEEQRSAQVAQDEAKCAGYGYAPGTTPFAQCMQDMDQRRIEAQQQIGVGISNALNSYSENARPTYRAPGTQAPTNWTCRHDTYMSTTRCSSY